MGMVMDVSQIKEAYEVITKEDESELEVDEEMSEVNKQLLEAEQKVRDKHQKEFA